MDDDDNVSEPDGVDLPDSEETESLPLAHQGGHRKFRPNCHSTGDDRHAHQQATKRTGAGELEEQSEEGSTKARRAKKSKPLPEKPRERSEQDREIAGTKKLQDEAACELAARLAGLKQAKWTTTREKAPSIAVYAADKAAADAAAAVAEAAAAAKAVADAARVHDEVHHQKKNEHGEPIGTPTPEVAVEGNDEDDLAEDDFEPLPDVSRGSGYLAPNGQRYRPRGPHQLTEEQAKEATLFPRSRATPKKAVSHRGLLKRAYAALKQRDNACAAASPPSVQDTAPKFDFKRLTKNSPLHRVRTRPCRFNFRHPFLYSKMRELEKEQRLQAKEDRAVRGLDQVRTDVPDEELWEHFRQAIEFQHMETEPTEVQHFVMAVPSSANADSTLSTIVHVSEPGADVAVVFDQFSRLLPLGGALDNVEAVVDELMKDTERAELSPTARQFDRIFMPRGDEQVVTVLRLRIFSFKQEIDGETSVLHFVQPLDGDEGLSPVEDPSRLYHYIRDFTSSVYDITHVLSRTLYVLTKVHLAVYLNYITTRGSKMLKAMETGVPLIEYDTKEYSKSMELIQSRRGVLPKQIVPPPTALAKIINGGWLLNRYRKNPLRQSDDPRAEVSTVHSYQYLPLEARLVARLDSLMTKVETKPFKTTTNLYGPINLLEFIKAYPQKQLEQPLTQAILGGQTATRLAEKREKELLDMVMDAANWDDAEPDSGSVHDDGSESNGSEPNSNDSDSSSAEEDKVRHLAKKLRRDLEGNERPSREEMDAAARTLAHAHLRRLSYDEEALEAINETVTKYSNEPYLVELREIIRETVEETPGFTITREHVFETLVDFCVKRLNDTGHVPQTANSPQTARSSPSKKRFKAKKDWKAIYEQEMKKTADWIEQDKRDYHAARLQRDKEAQETLRLQREEKGAYVQARAKKERADLREYNAKATKEREEATTPPASPPSESPPPSPSPTSSEPSAAGASLGLIATGVATLTDVVKEWGQYFSGQPPTNAQPLSSAGFPPSPPASPPMPRGLDDGTTQAANTVVEIDSQPPAEGAPTRALTAAPSSSNPESSSTVPKPEKKVKTPKPRAAVLPMGRALQLANNESTRLFAGTIDKCAYFEFDIDSQKFGLLLMSASSLAEIVSNMFDLVDSKYDTLEDVNYFLQLMKHTADWGAVIEKDPRYDSGDMLARLEVVVTWSSANTSSQCLRIQYKRLQGGEADQVGFDISKSPVSSTIKSMMRAGALTVAPSNDPVVDQVTLLLKYTTLAVDKAKGDMMFKAAKMKEMKNKCFGCNLNFLDKNCAVNVTYGPHVRRDTFVRTIHGWAVAHVAEEGLPSKWVSEAGVISDGCSRVTDQINGSLLHGNNVVLYCEACLAEDNQRRNSASAAAAAAQPTPPLKKLQVKPEALSVLHARLEQLTLGVAPETASRDEESRRAFPQQVQLVPWGSEGPPPPPPARERIPSPPPAPPEDGIYAEHADEYGGSTSDEDLDRYTTSSGGARTREAADCTPRPTKKRAVPTPAFWTDQGGGPFAWSTATTNAAPQPEAVARATLATRLELIVERATARREQGLTGEVRDEPAKGPSSAILHLPATHQPPAAATTSPPPPLASQSPTTQRGVKGSKLRPQPRQSEKVREAIELKRDATADVQMKHQRPRSIRQAAEATSGRAAPTSSSQPSAPSGWFHLSVRNGPRLKMRGADGLGRAFQEHAVRIHGARPKNRREAGMLRGAVDAILSYLDNQLPARGEILPFPPNFLSQYTVTTPLSSEGTWPTTPQSVPTPKAPAPARSSPIAPPPQPSTPPPPPESPLPPRRVQEARGVLGSPTGVCDSHNSTDDESSESTSRLLTEAPTPSPPPPLEPPTPRRARTGERRSLFVKNAPWLFAPEGDDGEPRSDSEDEVDHIKIVASSSAAMPSSTARAPTPLAEPTSPRRRQRRIADDSDDGKSEESTPQLMAAAPSTPTSLPSTPALDPISTPVAGPSAATPPAPTTPSKKQVLRDRIADNYNGHVERRVAVRVSSYGAGHSMGRQVKNVGEWEQRDRAQLASPAPTPSQAAQPPPFILDPSAGESSNYSQATNQESTPAPHSRLVLAPPDQVPFKGPILEPEDSPRVLSASVFASESPDECVLGKHGAILYARDSQGETQSLSSFEAAQPTTVSRDSTEGLPPKKRGICSHRTREPPKLVWKTGYPYLPQDGAPSQPTPPPLLDMLDFHPIPDEWNRPASPLVWYQNLRPPWYRNLPEPPGPPEPSLPPSPAGSDGEQSYTESQSDDDSYATMSDSPQSPECTSDPTWATPVPPRRSNRTSKTVHTPEPGVDRTPMPRPRRFPSAAEEAQSMHRYVQVRPQPGLGLGLQVIGGDVEESELVAVMLALSVYSPQRQPELIAAGHTDGQYAMRGAESILDARKAIGLCAANETTKGPPSLTLVGVRIPSAHDETDDMMLVAYANRAIKEGEHPTLWYGNEFGRGHYPDKGKSIRKDVPTLDMNDEDMLQKLMDHLACCDPEVRAYASFKAWGDTEERLCLELVELSSPSPTLPINMTHISYSEESILGSASTSEADRTPRSRSVIPSNADSSITRPRKLGVKSLETLTREANDAIIKACEPGGILDEHDLLCPVFTGPDIGGSSRFEITIPEHAFVRRMYGAAFISVTAPFDATGNDEIGGKTYACVMEIAPLYADRTLFEIGKPERAVNSRPQHPLMEKGVDQVRQFCCPERIEEMLRWIHVFCTADEDEDDFEGDLSEEMHRLYENLILVERSSRDRLTDYRRAALGLNVTRNEWKTRFRRVLGELTYKAGAKQHTTSGILPGGWLTSDVGVPLSLCDRAELLEMETRLMEAGKIPSPPPSPAAEERPIGLPTPRVASLEPYGARGQHDPRCCQGYKCIMAAARLIQEEWQLRQIRQLHSLIDNEDRFDGLENPTRSTEDRDVALDDRQKQDAINLADGPTPSPSDPDGGTKALSGMFCQTRPHAQEEIAPLSVIKWWICMQRNFDNPPCTYFDDYQSLAEDVQFRARRLSLLTRYDIVSGLEGYRPEWGHAVAHFKDTARRHASLQNGDTANGAAQIALSACSAALMVLIARVLGGLRSPDPSNDAALEEWLPGPPPPEEQVASPPPSPPFQRKGEASPQYTQPHGVHQQSRQPPSNSRPPLSKFESMRRPMSVKYMLSLLETKEEYLLRWNLREMPEDAQIIRIWNGRLSNVTLRTPRTHWTQTSMAPELKHMGPDRAQDVLNSWKEAYDHTNLYGPPESESGKNESKNRQNEIFYNKYLSHGPTYKQYLKETAASRAEATRGQYDSPRGKSQASTSTPPRAPSSPPLPERKRLLKQGGTLLGGDSLAHQTWPGPGFKGKQETEPAGTLNQPGVPFWGCVNKACPCPASHDGQKDRHCCRTCQAGRPCTKPFHVVPFSRPRPGPGGAFHRCVDPHCPCPASFNGRRAEHCCKKCQNGEPCRKPYHQTPTQPKMRQVRDFEVVRQAKSGLQTGEDLDLWEVKFEDSPDELFVTRLQPSDYQEWHEGERCPLPAIGSMPYYLPWTTSRPLPWPWSTDRDGEGIPSPPPSPPRAQNLEGTRASQSDAVSTTEWQAGWSDGWSEPSKSPPPSPPPSPPLARRQQQPKPANPPHLTSGDTGGYKSNREGKRREPINWKADVTYICAGHDTVLMKAPGQLAIDISNAVQRAREKEGMSRSFSLRNLHSVIQDSQGARCFSCAGWPHIDRSVEVLKDGTVICPICGVDAVVPASKVYSEAELHAWRFLAFKDKSQVQQPLKEDAKKHKEATRLYSSDPSESNHQYALRVADAAAEFKMANLRTCTKYAKHLDEITACNAAPRIEHLMEQINLATGGDATKYVTEAFNAKKALYTASQWEDMTLQRAAYLKKTRPRGAGLWLDTGIPPLEQQFGRDNEPPLNDGNHAERRKAARAHLQPGRQAEPPSQASGSGLDMLPSSPSLVGSHPHSRDASKSSHVVVSTQACEARLHPLYSRKDFERSYGNAVPAQGKEAPRAFRAQPDSAGLDTCQNVEWKTISRSVDIGETPAEFAWRLTNVYWIQLYKLNLDDPLSKSPRHARKLLFKRSNEIAQKFYECMTKEKVDEHPEVEALNLRLLARFREVWGARFHDREACPAEQRCGPPSLTGLLKESKWSTKKDPFPQGLVIPENRRCPHWRPMYLQRKSVRCQPCSRPDADQHRSKARGLPPSPPPSPPPTEATNLVKATPPTLFEGWARSYPTVSRALDVVQSDRGTVSKANELWKLATQSLIRQSTLPYEKLATSTDDVEIGEPAPPRDQLYPDPPAGPPDDGVHARDGNGKDRAPPPSSPSSAGQQQLVSSGVNIMDQSQVRTPRSMDCTSCGKSTTYYCTGISATDPGCFRGPCCQPNPACEFCWVPAQAMFPMCAPGSELTLVELPKERCARCVANGDPTGEYIADYYKCRGGNSQCEMRCGCKDARSSGLQSCNGCGMKFCSVHARAKRNSDPPRDISGHTCHGEHLAAEANVVAHLGSHPNAVATSPNMADRERSGPCYECNTPQDSREPCLVCDQLLCGKCLPQEMHGYCADTLQPLERKRPTTEPVGETLEGFVRASIRRRMGEQELTPPEDDCTELPAPPRSTRVWLCGLPPPSSSPPASPRPSPPSSPTPEDDAQRTEEPPPEETASPIVPPLPDLIEPISDTTAVQEPPEPQPVVVTAPLVTPTPLTAAEPSTVEPTPPSVTPAAEEPRPREVATPRLPGGPTGAEVSEVETTIRPARPITIDESEPRPEQPTQTVVPPVRREIQSPAYRDYVPAAPNRPSESVSTMSQEQRRAYEESMTEVRDLMFMLRAEREAMEATAQFQAERAARPQYVQPPPRRSESPHRQRQRANDEGQEENPEPRGQLQLRDAGQWERESEPERRPNPRHRDPEEPRDSSSRPAYEPDRPPRCTSARTYADPPESTTFPRGPPRSSHCAATRWHEAPSEGLNVEENLPQHEDRPRQSEWDAPRYPGDSRGQDFYQGRRRPAPDRPDEEDARSDITHRSEVSDLRDTRPDQTRGGGYATRNSDRDREGGYDEEREARRNEKVNDYLELFYQSPETTLEALNRSPECETIREVLASKADNRGEHWNARAFWVPDVISSWAYKYNTTRSEKAVNENLRNLEKIRFPPQLRDQDENVLGAAWEEYRGDLITTWRDCLRAGCAWEHMLQRILNSAKNKARGGNNPRVESLVRKALSDTVMYNNDLRTGGGYALLHADTLLWQLDESYATAHHGPQAASNAWARCTQFEEGETIVTLGGRVLTTYSKFIGMEEDLIHLDEHHRSVLFARVGDCLRAHKNKELGQALYCAWDDGVKYCKEAVRAKLMSKTTVTVDLILRMHVESKKSLLGFLADKHTPERRPRERAPLPLTSVEPRRSARLRREEVNAVNTEDHGEGSEDVAQPAAAVSPSGANDYSRVPPPQSRSEGRGPQLTNHERRWGRECTHPAGNKGHPTGKPWNAAEWKGCTIDYRQLIKLSNDPRFQKLMCRVMPMTKEMTSCRKEMPQKVDGAWGPQACLFCLNRPGNESTAWKSGNGIGSHVPTTCRTLKRFLAEGGDAQHAPMRQELQKCVFFRNYEPSEQKGSDRQRPRESDRR